MRRINKNQLKNIESYIMENGRTIEKAKWNYTFNAGDKDAIISELLKYQNSDGGFGKGLEADILMPYSSSIASTEAIFIAYEYELNCKESWFKNLLNYFENTIEDETIICSFWEKVSGKVEEYPHASWWNYSEETRFTPNPCAVVASAFLKYGSESQKSLGHKIAERCIKFLNSDEPCYDHDCYCLQTLIKVLQEIHSDLITHTTILHMNRRILGCLCTDTEKWMEYVAQPLDLVASPDSQWYKLVEPYIEENINFWLHSLNEEGYWQPNFSWGVDSEISREVTKIWRCYISVKRARILKAFKNNL
ncbi:hypothetical protein [Clostridium sp. KNHs214]|uniref:hypothetical protein n=1 Tax=Clostridium sp. KNHs214 TaxID=1540257 RepID=UPI0005518F01|nr:hypothetical protein [Clostridium sp. KNHs214]